MITPTTTKKSPRASKLRRSHRTETSWIFFICYAQHITSAPTNDRYHPYTASSLQSITKTHTPHTKQNQTNALTA